MRFAILSDLHGNLEATEAVLADATAHACDRFVCLGDVVGYNADSHECVSIVQKMNCPIVQGNHDEQAAREESSRDFNPMAEAAIAWTRAHLTDADKTWLRGLELLRAVDDFTIVHATLAAPGRWGYVFNEADAALSFIHQKTAVCFFGHTHVAGAFVRNGTIQRITMSKLPIERDNKYFINPGSVGQPRDGDWRAAYCIYDVGNCLVEQRRINYDIVTTQKKIIKAGLPPKLAERLGLGR